MIKYLKAASRILLVLLILTLVQQGPAIFALVARFPVEFKRVGPSLITADLSALPSGRYYLSVGHVADETTAYLNGNPIVTGTMALGTPFQIDSSGQHYRLDIRWNAESWRSQLFDFPVIMSYRAGNLLQAWRTFNCVYMGSVSAILMLISVLVHAKVSRAFAQRLKPHVLIALASFLYSFYLSGVPDLFWGLGPNTVIQILLRIALSASVIYLLGSYSRQNRLFLAAHIPFAAGILLAAIFRSDYLVSLYRLELGFFGVFTLISALRLANTTKDRGARLLVDFAMTWSFLHVVIITPFWGVGWGSYLTLWTPSFFAFLACLDFYLLTTEAIEFEAEAASAKRVYRMAGQVAHDIRSPLAALRTLISRLHVSAEEKELASLAFERIDGIARDVLIDYKQSRPVQFGHHLLVQIADLSLREKLVEFPALRASFASEASDSAITARFDPKQLKRVLSNILNNAIAASRPDGQIHVSLSQDHRFVTLTISDEGHGMSEKDVKSILSGDTLAPSPSGHGLGLSHALSCLEQWGGHLEIESKVGSGTKVMLRLSK